MIVNEEGKLFGKVSVIDIAVIAFAVIFAVAICVRFVMPSKFGEAMVDYTYTSTIKNVRIETVNALKKDIGKTWYDEKGTEIGVLVSAQEEPYIVDITKSDGSVEMAEMPEKYAVELKFEAKGIEGVSSVLLGGKREVSNGSNLLVNAENIAVTGTISDITKK